MLLFILVYVVTLTASFTFVDPKITVTNRLFAPVYVGMAVAALGHAAGLRGLAEPGPRRRRWIWSLAAVLVIVHVVNGTTLIVDRFRNGIDSSGREWVRSETMGYFRSLPGDTVVITNGALAVAGLTGMRTVAIPRDGGPPPGLRDGSGSVLALFRRAPGGVEVPAPWAESVAGREPVFRSPDGQVFRIP